MYVCVNIGACMYACEYWDMCICVNTVLPPLTNLIQTKKVFVSGNVLKLDLGGPLRTYFVLKSEKGPLPYV